MLPRKMRLGVFLIDCTELRNKLRQRIYDISGEVYRLLLERIKKDNEKLSKAIDSIIEKLRTEPTDIESMTAQLEYADHGVNVEMESINTRISEVMQKMDLLSTMNYRMAYEDFQKSWQIYSKPLAVKYRQQKCIRNIEQYHRKQFSDELTRSHDELLVEVQEIGWKFEKYTIYSRLTEVDVASQKFARLGERLDKAQQHADLINSRELLLKWKPTDFSELTSIRESFLPYYKVWTLARNFNCTVPTLLTGPLASIDKKLATEEIEGAYDELQRLEKNEFKNNHRILKLVQEVRGMYGEFRKYLPLINGLRNPDLRERHWQKVGEATNISNLNDSFDGSLQKLLDCGIMDRLSDVTEISEIASRELSYEKLLNKLKKDWRETRLCITPS
jgi:dynein heavy chain